MKKEKFIANERKNMLLAEAHYMCEVCGKVLKGRGQLAHRINKGINNSKYYRGEILHHRLNLVVTCDNGKCNDSVLVDNNPLERKKLLKKIKEDLNKNNYIFLSGEGNE